MAANRVFLGNLSRDARERDIEKFFKGYGRVREIILKDGFGFVELDNERDAEDAIYDLNGKSLCGQRVAVEMSRPRGGRDRGDRGFGGGRSGGGFRSGGGGGFRPFGGRDNRNSRYGAPHSTPYKVRIENLSSRIMWQDLRDYMNKGGEVTYADTNKNQEHEGFVCFASYSDMKRAIAKLDGTELNGRKIKLVSEYVGKSRSESGSRSRSRSKSTSAPRGKRNQSSSRSRSPSPKRSAAKRGHSSSRSRSASPKRIAGKKGRSSSHSRSPPAKRAAKTSENGGSRSVSPADSPKDNGKVNMDNKSASRSRSRSCTPPPPPKKAAEPDSPGAKQHSRSASSAGSRSRSRSSSGTPPPPSPPAKRASKKKAT